MKVPKNRIVGWASFIIITLLIPFTAMQLTPEVRWSISDFILMGTLLTGIALTYELIARKSNKRFYRFAFALALLGAFLLFWINGAVGIIGNEKQEANLLFGIVIAAGFIGALLSRFKAKGMSVTLFIVALIQLLIPVIAYIIWPPTVISWSPGVIEVFLMSGFFSLIFMVSGVLFRLASGKESLEI
jgi:hypothetical protein